MKKSVQSGQRALKALKNLTFLLATFVFKNGQLATFFGQFAELLTTATEIGRIKMASDQKYPTKTAMIF